MKLNIARLAIKTSFAVVIGFISCSDLLTNEDGVVHSTAKIIDSSSIAFPLSGPEPIRQITGTIQDPSYTANDLSVLPTPFNPSLFLTKQTTFVEGYKTY